MKYKSTRGWESKLSSAEAIKIGIAPDGGLFVPDNIVKLANEDIIALKDMTYQQRAVQILKHFLTDYTIDEITECVNKAYTCDKFSSSDIAPLNILNVNASILELWHGPTCAFKDMALQILPHLLVKAIEKTGESDEIVILVATSGDTGKAALEGFKDVKGTRIIVFFPNNGVSEVQRLQMVTQEGTNVHSIAVEGNFDDTQTGVKEIFCNTELEQTMAKAGLKFSSANSINWGRLVPQIVYYFSAYADLLKKDQINYGDKINFVVPTGNFGNILAGYFAMRMGLPVNKLVCASNENNILTDFINTGIYDKNREFKKTMSPSMDILISSNLERLLYEVTGQDSGLVCEWMNELKANGVYEVNRETLNGIKKIFWAGYTTEKHTLQTISEIYKEYNYVVDTHTAVGIDVYDKYVISTADMTKTVIVSTASPFKFNESVAEAIFGAEEIKGQSEFKLLEVLSEKCGIIIPEGLKKLDTKPVLHSKVCEKGEMKQVVENILGI